MVGERDVTEAFAGQNWKLKRMGGRLVLPGAAGEIDEACACGEKTAWRGKAMPGASLIVVDAGNSLGEEGPARKAAERHVWKWTE